MSRADDYWASRQRALEPLAVGVIGACTILFVRVAVAATALNPNLARAAIPMYRESLVSEGYVGNDPYRPYVAGRYRRHTTKPCYVEERGRA